VALGIVLGGVALALGLRSRSDPVGKAGAMIGGATAGGGLLLVGGLAILWWSRAAAPRRDRPAVETPRTLVSVPSPYQAGRTYRLARRARVTMIDAGQPAGSMQYGVACTVAIREADDDEPTQLSVQYAGACEEPVEPEMGMGPAFRKPRSFTIPLPDPDAGSTTPRGAALAPDEDRHTDASGDIVEAVLREAALAPVRFLPPGPVRPSATWDAPLEEVAMAFRGGLRLRPAKPSVSCTLAEVRKGPEGEIGVITIHRSTVAAAAAMGNGPWRSLPPSQGTMTCVLSGEVRYDLASGRPLVHQITLRSIEPDAGGVEIRWETELHPIEVGPADN
jgi:hypothetical protein